MPIRSDGITSLTFSVGTDQFDDGYGLVCLEYADGTSNQVRCTVEEITEIANYCQIHRNQSYNVLVEEFINPKLYPASTQIVNRILDNIRPGEIVAVDVGANDDRIGFAVLNSNGSLRTNGATDITYNPNTVSGTPIMYTSPRNEGGFFEREYNNQFSHAQRTALGEEDTCGCNCLDPPPTKIKYPPMNCACCKNKIDQPENMAKLLGEKELEKYIEFCKFENQEPSLYCCSCYATLKESPRALNMWRIMIEDRRTMADTYVTLQEQINKAMTERKQGLKERDDLLERYREFGKEQAILLNYWDELKRNPIKLILLQWRAHHYSKINPKKRPKFVGEREVMELVKQNPDMHRGLTQNQFLDALYKPRFGQRYRYNAPMQSFIRGYNKIRFYGFHIKNKGIEPRLSLSIPIPYMKQDHGLGLRIH